MVVAVVGMVMEHSAALTVVVANVGGRGQGYQEPAGTGPALGVSDQHSGHTQRPQEARGLRGACAEHAVIMLTGRLGFEHPAQHAATA